jgi:Holliday junction resolvase RusA-like endonuclease
MTHSFTIPGRLIGKGRPKFSKAGGFVRVYTPEKTRNCEAMVRSFGLEAMGHTPPLAGPVWLSVHSSIIPPPSWSKKRRAAATFVTGKPDLDNVLKLVGDSLNGVCWVDDSQISAVFFVRTYTLDQAEMVKVQFGEITDDHNAVAFERPAGIPEEMPLFAGAGP